MTERKLATVRRINAIDPIEGADFIELVYIDGWQCVSREGEFEAGDLCVYFEIDSFLPIEERYEFLRKSSYKKIQNPIGEERSEGFRLRTVRLRNTLSQGLAMPLSSYPEIKAELGDDLTVALNIEKYEPPVPAVLAGEVRRMFPGFLIKTDEERIQNLPNYFEAYKDLAFECTEKLDGSSMTVYWNNGNFGVCSRNLDLLEDSQNTYWKVAKDLELEKVLQGIGRNLALQGELIGEGIQKNRLKIKGHEFYLFNIWDIDKKRYLDPDELFAVYLTLGPRMKHVPVLKEDIRIFRKAPTMEAMLDFAIGRSLINEDVHREGVVLKSTRRVGAEIISFKIVSNKYLLKHKG